MPDLLDIQAMMAALSVDLLIRRTSDRTTATAKGIEADTATSVLQAMATAFADSLTRALRNLERWMGVAEPRARAEVDASFALMLHDQTELNAILQARADRDISREDFLIELKRRNILREVFDLVENERRLLGEPTLGGESTEEPIAGEPGMGGMGGMGGMAGEG